MFPSPGFVFLEQTLLWGYLSDRAGVVGEKAPRQEYVTPPGWKDSLLMFLRRKETRAGSLAAATTLPGEPAALAQPESGSAMGRRGWQR